MDTYSATLQGQGSTALAQACEPELQALFSTPQSAVFHAEGDVGVHTQMVLVEAERTAPALATHEAALLRLGALLHDVGKPATTRDVGGGEFSSHGHAEEGARLVNLVTDRSPLLSLPLGVRVGVHALVRSHMWHHHPEDVSRGAVLRLGQLVPLSILQELWRCDTAGRVCPDSGALAEQVELMGMEVQEMDVEELPQELITASQRSRRVGLRALVEGRVARGGALTALVERSERSGRSGSLTYTIGLPGVGKSTWAEEWATRTGGQLFSSGGRRRRDRRDAALAARQEAFAAAARGEDVLLDATHGARESRDALLGFAERYSLAVHAVYFDSPLSLALERQRIRPWEDAVPDEAVLRMRQNMRFPTPDEYDDLLVVDTAGEWEYTSKTRWGARVSKRGAR